MTNGTTTRSDFNSERDILGQWSRPRVEKMVSLTADWYGFEELVWSGNRGGRGEQFRTAAVFQPSDEGATIANQFG